MATAHPQEHEMDEDDLQPQRLAGFLWQRHSEAVDLVDCDYLKIKYRND